jgi:hypothetical protein
MAARHAYLAALIADGEGFDLVHVNSRRFHARWRRWPMEGRVRAFADRGLVDWNPAAERLELRSSARAEPAPY